MRAEIAEGVALITASLAKHRVGPYQLQAAIAAVHDEAGTADDTDWPQILGLYELLSRSGAGADGGVERGRRSGDGRRSGSRTRRA